MKKMLPLLMMLLLVGCNNGKATFLTTNTEEQYKEQRQEIEQVLKDDQHVKRVTALFTKNSAIIGIEIKPLSKWNKQKYEKKWKEEMEKALSDKNVLVSTDLKIIMETDKLAKKNLSEEELDKKIEKLKDLEKEET